MRKQYKCPCCGMKTLSQKAGGTYEICRVCNWEDDPVQFRDWDFAGGANAMSLRQARVNYRAYRKIEGIRTK